jgi:xanthine dehydrogenase accessory factor
VKDIIDDVNAWRERGERAAVATVIEVYRSAPRPPGAKMAVAEGGAISGAVSGGCVESAVVDVAERVLRGEGARLEHFGYADEEAWDVGLPCGGEIDVWVEPWGHDRLAELAHAGERAAQVTRLDPGAARLVVRAGGATEGTLGDPGLDRGAVAAAEELMWAERSERRTLGDVEVFVDVVHPPPRLLVVGAVDFAASVCDIARAAGLRPYVIDPRARFATAERFPDAEEVVVAWPSEGFARLGGLDRATAVAVLTHDPKLDDDALLAALRSDAGYVGAMGSRKAQAVRRERLLAAGMTDADLTRLSAPIGLDLGATSAQETALSIVGEVVAHRHGRTGGRLADAKGRIHPVGGPKDAAAAA